MRFNLIQKSVEKACFRANQCGKKICAIKSNILYFTYAHGIGGNAGKVLRIWSEPFKTQGEAQAFISSSESIHLDTSKNEYASDDRDTDDVLSALKQDSHIHSHEMLIHTCKNPLSAFAKSTQKQQHLALEKKSIIKEWEVYKTKGVNAKDFIALLNAGGQYSIALSENKLYAWQRAYKRGDLSYCLMSEAKIEKPKARLKSLD